MNVLPGYALLVLSLGAPPGPVDAVGPGRPRPGGYLSEEDACYLEYLTGDFLFDPKGATRVRVWVPGRGLRLFLPGDRVVATDAETRDGWLVRGATGQPARVYFTDGESIPLPAARVQPLDFEAHCARRFRPGPADGQVDLARLVRLWYEHDDDDLTLAAWLHCRGYDGLAAQALAAARAADPNRDPRKDLRERLAERAADALRDAFCARADAAALAHGERLLRLFPDVARKNDPQAADMVADLKRRQKAGTFGKASPKDPPAGFAGWPVERKVAYLIDALDEVEGASGPFELGERNPINDRRYEALVALGEPAIPALIDAIERDDRLTRCPVPVGRGGCLSAPRSERGRVFAARAMAEAAARSILRVQVFDPIGPGDDDPDGSPAAVAGLMRWYWDRYGKLPFPDRMMNVLTDPAARPFAQRDAAEQLVSAYRDRGPSWARAADRAPAAGRGLHPALARFTGPTAGEAILAAVDRERRERATPQGRDPFAETYAGLLADLGDPRMVPELARRAAAARTLAERLALIAAAHRLGASGPLLRLAREVEAGTVWLQSPPGSTDPPDGTALDGLGHVVWALSAGGLPEAGRALFALADSAHPLHALTADAVLNRGDVYSSRPWRHHPFCLAVLRAHLTDPRPTGVHYYLRGDEMERTPGDFRTDRDRTGRVTDPAAFSEHVEERVCDYAAAELADLVVGLPEFHPLRRDADRTRAEINGRMVRFGQRVRWGTSSEDDRWSPSVRAPYVPEIRPLGRPATPADVTTGRAVFHLAGRGRVADVRLPAWLVLTADAKGAEPVYGLAVQAEVGPDGKVLYGAIFRHAVRPVPAGEVERVEAYKKE